MKQRAATIKENGLIAIVDAVCQGALSNYTKLNSPLSTALVRSLILGTSVDGYAGCAIALAEAVEPKLELITAKTLILYGTEDYLINTLGVEGLCRDIQGAQAKELKNQGHWNCIEDPRMLAEEIEGWLRA